MKTKIIMIIDVILIIITILYLWNLNNTPSYGLEALDDLGHFILGLGILGIEALIFIITGIIMIYKHFHK